MAVDIRKIKKLIELIEKSGVSEIEIREGEESIRISKSTAATSTTIPIPQMVHHEAMPAAVLSGIHPAASEGSKLQSSQLVTENHQLKSPMVGTVYIAPKPGEKPFVEIGQKVVEGEVVCLIEAMKMFNQIESDKTGIVRARLIENGQPIEYDQPLFIIEPEFEGNA